MHIVMKKIFLSLFILSFFCAAPAFSEEIEINGEVVEVNLDLEFFVIDSGDDDGVELGDGLIVHRSGEKIAEAYIIEVRSIAAAAEILKTEDGEEIKKGDSFLMVKRTGHENAAVTRSPRKTAAPPTSKWKPLLGPGRDKLPQESSAIFPEPMERAGIEYAPSVISKGIAFEIEIDSKPEIVFSYAGLILRENGYSVISSSRITGALAATKPIELSLLKELWADSMAAIDHKVLVSFEIKPASGSTKLKVTPYREHTQKEKYIKRAVLPGSKYYKELANIAYMIKKRSEY